MFLRILASGSMTAAVACSPAPVSGRSEHQPASLRSVVATATDSVDGVGLSVESSGLSPPAPTSTVWRATLVPEGYRVNLDESFPSENIFPLDEAGLDCARTPPSFDCISTAMAGVELKSATTSSRLVALRFDDYYEHDGMYGIEERIALAVPVSPSDSSTLAIVATLVQWETDVVDCGTTIRMNRFASATIDDQPVVCIESVVEEGVGLFDIMDLHTQRKPWLPLARSRMVRAFAWNADKRTFSESSSTKCPKRDYGFFVPIADQDEALAPRANVQGESTTIPCPPYLFGGCMVSMCEGKSKPKP